MTAEVTTGELALLLFCLVLALNVDRNYEILAIRIKLNISEMSRDFSEKSDPDSDNLGLLLSFILEGLSYLSESNLQTINYL